MARKARCAVNNEPTTRAAENARNELCIIEAIEHLRTARELLKQAGARKATAKVRLALTSAGGALRHAETAGFRQERQAHNA